MKTNTKQFILFFTIAFTFFHVKVSKAGNTYVMQPVKKSHIILLDSLDINKYHFNHYSGSGYFKVGDSIKWIVDTNTLQWQKADTASSLEADIIAADEQAIGKMRYKGNIWYLIPIKIAPALLNQPLCFHYHGTAAFEIYLNGKLMVKKGIVSTNKNDEIISHGFGYFYATFTKPYNYLTIRSSNHSSISDISSIRFSIWSDKEQQKNMESDSVSDTIDIALGIFFFAFFFIYLNLFFQDRKIKANLYFSLFCFFIFFTFFTAADIANTENHLLDTVLSSLEVASTVFLFYTFLCFLHQLVFGQVKKYLKWIFVVCVLLAIVIASFYIYDFQFFSIIIFGLIAFALFVLIDGVRVVFIGRERKIKGIKPVIYGVLISVSLLVVVFILSTNGLLKGNLSFSCFALSIAAIPISVSIALVNNYTNTSKQLARELVNVSALSEKTIKQEKEKQQILESQNVRLEEQVTLRTTEIVKQKNEIEQQKHLIEEHQKEMIDSITYAKRIQDAILPPLSLIEKYLPESFVLYKPKDIVAGDFYWMEAAGGNILIAAADCTGHGVPGALVSVVCSNALNRAVKEFKITEPGKILDKVRELVLETFEKSESNVQDGMDISLCCINIHTCEVQWSGAYNPLWYIQQGVIHEVGADKQPIGKFDTTRPFNTHTLKLNKGDTMYLFTDGYADQFGGTKGKKFKYQQLQEKLLAIYQKPMAEQKQLLEQALESWKGSLDQVDDVLLIGIRI
ncbi:MAG: PP2C family protein-serine/threonine phosphatase [Bacteroidia bacterium]